MAKQIPYFILACAKDVFGVWPDDKSRKREFVDCKRAVVFYLKNYICNKELSFHFIGTQLGGKDHSTMIHALKTHPEIYQVDRQYREKYDLFFERCEEIRQKTEAFNNNKPFFCSLQRFRISRIGAGRQIVHLL